MKEFSKEVVEIDGNNYTLFLNRKGIVAWEKFSKEEREKAKEFSKKYKQLSSNDNNIDLKNDTNPFDGLEDIDNLDSDISTSLKIYEKLYWIMLYTDYKFTVEEAKELFDKALNEYGLTQIIQLANQMISEANADRISSNSTKKLEALKPQE